MNADVEAMAAATTVARRRGRPKVVSDEVQHAQIVEAGRALFIAAGYGATSMDDIAARCRISKQTLYRHFPAKTALFAAIVDSHTQRLLDVAQTSDDLPLDRALERILLIDMDEAEERERAGILRIALIETLHHPELHDILKTRGRDRALGDLAAWIGRQQARGRLRPGDPARFARMLLDMVFVPIAAWVMGEVIWDGQDGRRAHIRDCVAVFLGGVTSPPDDTPTR